MSRKNPYATLSTQQRGFNQLMGVQFPEIGDEKCVVTLPMRPEFLNAMEVAHGGVISTLTDVAAGTMALHADRRAHGIVTQSCTIHYLRPATGAELRAESRIVRKGRRICVTSVDVFSGDGSLAATALYEIYYLDED